MLLVPALALDCASVSLADALIAIRDVNKAVVSGSSSWTAQGDPCAENWDGVVCLPDGTVSLALAGADLSGVLAEEVTCISASRVNVSFNPLLSGLPEGLPSLVALDVSYTGVQQLPTLQTVDNLDVSGLPLSALPSSVLSASPNSPSSLRARATALTTVPSLDYEVVDVSFSPVTSIAPEVFYNVRKLYMMSTNLTEIPTVDTTQVITTVFHLSECSPAVPTLSVFNTHLTDLVLEDLSLVELPTGLVLDSLISLSLKNNKFIEVPDLSAATLLESLDMSQNVINTRANRVVYAKNVNLAGNSLSKDLELPNVVSLVLDDNEYVDYPLSAPSASLTLLSLRGNQFVESSRLRLGDLPALRHLNIGGNPLEDVPTLSGSYDFIGLSGLAFSFDFSSLSVHSMDLSGCGLSALPAAPVFTGGKLDLSDNDLQELPTEWAEGLTAVSLAKNSFEAVPSALLASATLEALDMRFNRLSAWPTGFTSEISTLLLGHNPLPADAVALEGTVVDLSGLAITSLPELPDGLRFLNISSTCIRDPLPSSLASYVNLGFDFSCIYSDLTDGFNAVAYIEALRGTENPVEDLTSTPRRLHADACPWLHCPNAQEDPVAPGREETSFNVFGACRAGYECSGIGPGTKCANGSYSTGGASSCTDCSGWREITGPNHDQCQALSGSQFADPSHINPVSCGPGCYMVAGVAHECPIAHRCPGDGLYAACGTGTYQDSIGQSACKPVFPGFYTDVDTRDVVHKCVEGYYCSGQDAQPEPCPPGTFAVAQSSECVVCAQGHTSEGLTGDCTACSAFENTTYCETIENTVFGEVTVPAECPTSSYITGKSRQECKKCSADFKCDGTTKHEFSLSPFSTVDPTTASGILTFLMIVLVLCVAGYTGYSAYNKRGYTELEPVDIKRAGELVVLR